MSLMHHRADLPHLPKDSTAMGKKGMPRDLEARLYVRCFAASASRAAALSRRLVVLLSLAWLEDTGGGVMVTCAMSHEVCGGIEGMTIIRNDVVQAKASLG